MAVAGGTRLRSRKEILIVFQYTMISFETSTPIGCFQVGRKKAKISSALDYLNILN